MDLGLKGKIAIVTGGSAGIGRGIVERLVQEGAIVTIVDINIAEAEKTATEIGGDTQAIKMDITNKNEVESVVDKVIEKFGRIDILVNNAALSWPRLFIEMTEKEWDHMCAVNLKGVYLISRPVLSNMVKQRYGKIISISSIAGKEGIAKFSHYSATKFAVIGLTQALAHEYAEYGVNINVVCPGVVRTPLWEDQLPGMAEEQGKSTEQVFQEFCEPIPFKRPQTPEDIGSMVSFLASDLAKNITGQSINVTGGWHMH
ncbi:SDR family NAD(P)-dependent oxidoreductase [Desulfopila sp. IMCC35008]|uniref:SDR family NAD(P)-dependent oxidoreductase n=1 Tax=Desulfopila sp. IMCC35008 TaxID=2653858 RepID=UPI0013D7BFDC|nr:SDR family NAD(P)-dependent oxidoreductase [Desulfopila sp. IMCC35008]